MTSTLLHGRHRDFERLSLDPADHRALARHALHQGLHLAQQIHTARQSNHQAIGVAQLLLQFVQGGNHARLQACNGQLRLLGSA